MGTATIPATGGDHERGEVRPDEGPAEGEGTCGVLGQIDDDRLRLMTLIVRTHRQLTDRLGRELEQNVGIPLVFFDVLIHVGGAPESRLTMSRLSADVALTTEGVEAISAAKTAKSVKPSPSARPAAKPGRNGSAAKAKSTKRVYFFGNGKAEGNAGMKDLLGGKGANLADMTLVPLPVPRGGEVKGGVERIARPASRLLRRRAIRDRERGRRGRIAPVRSAGACKRVSDSICARLLRERRRAGRSPGYAMPRAELAPPRD